MRLGNGTRREIAETQADRTVTAEANPLWQDLGMQTMLRLPWLRSRVHRRLYLMTGHCLGA